MVINTFMYWVISIVTLIITLITKSHGPLSRLLKFSKGCSEFCEVLGG